MRSSQKSGRNRGNKNRSKSLGNVQNRVFESAGPEGKVRGTPQQIIDKYEQLARDAQTSGDRVMSENFLQHAEHYARLLSQAQAEMAAHQQRQNEQQARHNEHGGGKGGGGNGGGGGQRHDHGHNGANGQARGDGGSDGPSGGGLETIDTADDGPSLIATPEADQPGGGGQPDGEGGGKSRSRRRRGPRKDRGEDRGEDGGSEASGGGNGASEGEGGESRPAADAPVEGC